jgi:2-methylisocitrate lyase-like PEP mutase family enzyme
LSAFIVTIERFASSSEARNEYRASIESSATQQLPSVKLSGVGDAAQRLGSTVLVLKRNWVYGFTLVAPDANSAGAQRVLKVVEQITPRL